MKTTLWFFFLTWVLTGIYLPQTFGQGEGNILIKGTVTDASDNRPLKATITVQSFPEASEVYIEDTDDSTGRYMLNVHTQNKYVIEVSAPYYKPELDTLDVWNNTKGLDFELLSVKPGKVLRLQNIFFAQGDHHIQDNSMQELSEIALLLFRYPDMKIQLEGHTDRLGGRKANLLLSEKRVEEIKKYLTGLGIHQKRIKTRAFGGSRPISTDNTEESRQMNRRVEVRILRI